MFRHSGMIDVLFSRTAGVEPHRGLTNWRMVVGELGRFTPARIGFANKLAEIKHVRDARDLYGVAGKRQHPNLDCCSTHMQ